MTKHHSECVACWWWCAMFFFESVRDPIVKTMMRCPHTLLPSATLCRALRSPAHKSTCRWIWELRRTGTDWSALREVLRHNLSGLRASTVRAALQRHDLERWWTGTLSPAGLPVLRGDTPPQRGLLLLQAPNNRDDKQTLLELLLSRRVPDPTAFVARWRRHLLVGGSVHRSAAPEQESSCAKRETGEEEETKSLISRLCDAWFYPWRADSQSLKTV